MFILKQAGQSSDMPKERKGTFTPEENTAITVALAKNPNASVKSLMELPELKGRKETSVKDKVRTIKKGKEKGIEGQQQEVEEKKGSEAQKGEGSSVEKKNKGNVEMAEMKSYLADFMKESVDPALAALKKDLLEKNKVETDEIYRLLAIISSQLKDR
ncbi:hypothetical protein TSUD_49730 [Trifolium subterraneum]|uniref:Uncharacterized protein n=1 Tax=Trifolium subterraneum TaxID=3900 RepID=A0A2Z6M0M2_TRISU|nr:hypothetical protein TSUD_49730 [Trifolium subterraneum]